MSNVANARAGAGRFPLGTMSAGARAGVTVLLLALVALWAGVLALESGTGSSNGQYYFFVACFAVLAVYGITWVFRTAAWLEGTTLVVRGALLARRCDLSRAQVSLGAGWRGVPRLTARAGRSTRPVRLPLGRPFTDSIRSGPAMLALADAITSGGRTDQEGWRVANSLRGWAGPQPGGWAGPRPVYPPR
jgi:hypothetical protein